MNVAPGKKHRLLALAAVWICAGMMPLTAIAIDWEHLVMPGPVISGHADTEKQCKKCHAPFAGDQQRRLCLDCHIKIAGDIGTKTGFHGRSEPARVGQCRNCHTDHEGRGADIVRLTPQTFNHALTDFALEGAHKGLACAGCHEPKAKHRDAPATCFGCHAEDDFHKKALGQYCETCHGVAAWKDTKFDHDLDTRYPLKGAHVKVDCALCHAGQRYQETPTTCVACHRINDVHQGQRGTDCERCHDTVAWKEQAFDHLKETGFALTAGHSGLACQACHAGNDFKKTAGKECVACHGSDDTHQGRNGPQCQDCHTTMAWNEVKFDHARQTKFALDGAHADLTCVACHKGEARTEKLDTSCVSCHRSNDPHRESLGTDCGACHGEKSWAADIRFDHDLTRFPLVGLHATTSCQSCHADKRFKDTPAACIDCHRANDVHKRALGEKCETCHTPNDWRIWTFDHNTQTDFRIEGAHVGLQCAACHFRPMREGSKLPDQCIDCHRGDDVHNGQFGSDCARCHDSRSFARARRRSQP
jgi:hypothetical protein